MLQHKVSRFEHNCNFALARFTKGHKNKLPLNTVTDSDWRCKDEIDSYTYTIVKKSSAHQNVSYRSSNPTSTLLPNFWLPSLPYCKYSTLQSLVKVKNLEIDKALGIKVGAKETFDQYFSKCRIIHACKLRSGKIAAISPNRILILEAFGKDKDKTWRIEKDYLIDKVDHIETDISMEIIDIVMKDKTSILQIIPEQLESTALFISMLLFTIKIYLKSNEFLNVIRLDTIASLPSLKQYHIPRPILFSSLAKLEFFDSSNDEINEKEFMIQIGLENYRPLHLSFSTNILEFFIPPVRPNEAPKLLSVPIIETSSLRMRKEESWKRDSTIIMLTWNSITLRIAGIKSKIDYWYKLLSTGRGHKALSITVFPKNEMYGFFLTHSDISLVSLNTSKMICNCSIRNVSFSKVKRMNDNFSFTLSIDPAEANEDNIVENFNEVTLFLPLRQYYNFHTCLKMLHKSDLNLLESISDLNATLKYSSFELLPNFTH